MGRWILALALLPFARCLDTEPLIVENEGEDTGKDDECVDADSKCPQWATAGECTTNATWTSLETAETAVKTVWMTANCRRSCDSCNGGDTAWRLRSFLAAKFHKAGNASADHSRLHRHVALLSLTISHVHVDEEREMMSMSGKMVAGWNDSALAWTREDWGGLSWLNFYWNSVWTPTLVQTNAPPGETKSIERKVLAANYTGELFLWADFDFKAPCDFDYSAFPRDSQRCCFKLDDKRYYAVKIKVGPQASLSAIDSLASAHISGWEGVDVDIMESRYALRVLSETSQDPYAVETSNCDICVTLERNRAYFGGDIVGPAVAAAFLTLISFLLTSFTRQMHFLLVSLLLQFITICITASQLPPASGGAPTILKFNGFNLGITLGILFFTLLLHNMAAMQRLPPPHWLKLVVGCTEKVMPCLKLATASEKPDPQLTPEAGEEGEGVSGLAETTPAALAQAGGRVHGEGEERAGEWAGLARTLKYLLFAVALAVYTVLLLGSFAA